MMKKNGDVFIVNDELLTEGTHIEMETESPRGSIVDFNKGDVGEIITVNEDDEGLPYEVKFEENRTHWIYPSEIKNQCGKHKTKFLRSKSNGRFCPFCHHDQ